MEIKNVKEEFEKAIQNKSTYVQNITNLNRNLGKTQLLIDLSRKYNIPILSLNKSHERYLKSLNTKVKIVDNINDINSNIILIDEGLTKCSINILKDKCKIVGFYRYYTGII